MHDGMVEPVQHGAVRSFRLRPIGMRRGNPPRGLDRAASDVGPDILRELSSEYKAPAITFGVGGVTGGADEIAELQVTDRMAGDGKRREHDGAWRAFAVLRKPPVVRSHHERARDQGTPAARDRRRTCFDRDGRDRRPATPGPNLGTAAGIAVAHALSAEGYFCFSSSQNALSPAAFISSRIFSRGMTPQRLAQA